MLQKVGFFHFGADHSMPIQALKRALEHADDIEGALIVLPEAFNISVPYRGEGDRNFDPSVLDKVKDLAERFGVAFLAGLIIQECCGSRPPYSGAYLITGKQHTLMCYKAANDGTTDWNYTPRVGTNDFNNPISYEGIRIGALICADANPPKIPLQCMLEHTNSMRKRMDKIVDDCDVLCVPAHMNTGNFANGEIGKNTDVPKILILANSKPDGLPSFITNCDGVILKPTVCGSVNRIVTVDGLSRV